MTKRFYWADEHDEFIRTHVKGRTHRELTELFNKEFNVNVTPLQIENFKQRKGYHSGVNGQFKKGHKSWNQGKHPPSVGRMAETQFKKGHESKNKLPVGTISQRRDGKFIKISDTEWQKYNQYVWEQAHGEKMPEGSVIISLDRDTNNYDPNNLMLVTHAELCQINRCMKLTGEKDINKAIIYVAKLKTATQEKKRGDK